MYSCGVWCLYDQVCTAVTFGVYVRMVCTSMVVLVLMCVNLCVCVCVTFIGHCCFPIHPPEAYFALEEGGVSLCLCKDCCVRQEVVRSAGNPRRRYTLPHGWVQYKLK